MVEHQSGTLSDLEEAKTKTKEEVVEEEANVDVVTEPLEDEEEQIVPDLDKEDWMSKLNEGEVFNSKDKGACPRLHGLRRVAKPFIKTEDSRVQLMVVPRQVIRTVNTYNSAGDIMSSSEELGTHNYPLASVTFSVTDIYGRTYCDSADAYYSNCNELGHFPTAVASARAEARVLRKMLGITQHAAEEMADKDAGEELAPDDDKPVKGTQVKLINKILQDLEDFTMKDLFDNVTAREVYNVDDLTTGEARQALRLLHNKKKAKKKKGGKK